MKKLYLVDVSSMFFRAFYAVRPLTSPSGMPTNAIYGFTSMILKLLKEEKPDYLGFCYDLPTPSFRKEIYPEYKAHRNETPPDLIPQIPYIKKMVDAFGIPSFEVDGYEADDIIGTLTEIGLKHHCQVTIVSGDKDFGQLVRPGVILYDTMKDTRLDSEGVKAKWGVRPDQFIDFLSLIGDVSDNIPGVEGVGPKTAEKLLSDYGTLENIYENLSSVKSESLRGKLIKGKDSAFLSKKLVKIESHIPLVDQLEKLKPSPLRESELMSLLKELNFKTFEKTLLSNFQDINLMNDDKKNVSNTNKIDSDGFDELGIPLSAHQKKDSPKNLDHNNQPKDNSRNESFKVLLEKAVSIENINLIPECSEVWAFYDSRGHYIVYKDDLVIINSDAKKWGELITQKKLVYQGFDLKTFWRDLGIHNPQIKWDSQLAAYLIKTEEVGSFEETVSEFLLKNIPQFATPSELYHYHDLLFHKLKSEIEHHNFHQLLHDIELPIAPILLSMEQNGILVDTDNLERQSKQLEYDIKTLEKEIHHLSGSEFNIASPKQLAQILFDKLSLPAGKKTKTGFSTDSEVLEKLKSSHSIIAPILEYRELTKLKSTYVDALPLLVNPETHRIHTHFNQALTTTGRLSSAQPNLQNIPIRTPRGQEIRKAFIAPSDSVLLSLDYSQIELRVLAHLTDDPGLCRAFLERQDIHAATASEVFEVPLGAVTSDMRRTAKAINFGIAYGQGAYGLAENLGISRSESMAIIKRYFTRFHKVKEYMEFIVNEAKKHASITNIFGRQRILRELKSSNPVVRKFGERAAINAPVQSAASDIVKKAMLSVFEIKNAKMILQVHDELLFECSEKDADEVSKILKNKMENVVKLKVPLVVNIGVGKNWDEAH